MNDNIRWPTLIAIPILVAATFFELYLIWGLLFLYWSYRGIRSNEAFLVEIIDREDNAILFWLINVAWIAFGLYNVLSIPFGPEEPWLLPSLLGLLGI